MTNRLTGNLFGASAMVLAMAISGGVLAQDAAAPVVAAAVETTSTGEASSGVIVLGAEARHHRLVSAAGLSGLEVFDLTGARLAAVPAGEAGGLDVRYGFPIKGRPEALLVSTDKTDNALRFFAMRNGAPVEVGARAVPLGFAVEDVCLLRNASDGGLYAVAVGDGGEIEQLLLYADAEGRVDARSARRINLPSKVKYCVADDATGQLYVSQQAVGVWRFNGDPEADAAPALVDAAGLGRITEESGALALYDGGQGARYLIATDASSGRLFVYDHGTDDAYLGAASLTGRGGAAVKEPGALQVVGAPLAGLPAGALLVTDEDAPEGANYKLVSIAALTGALNLSAGTPQDARAVAAPRFPAVVAVAETAPVGSPGDAADDPAIWADQNNPANSLIIGTDKKAGLNLYDMQGRVIQHLPDGKMNNVDLREGFVLGGQPVVLVTASDRTNKAVAIYRLDTEARRLINIADGVQPTGQGDPYGQCMYRSARSGKTYVFINDSNGEKRQWELVDAGNGKVRAVRVRDFAFSSQVEGCVADDVSGLLFVAEEDVGLWRLSAEPDGGSAMTMVARITENPALKDDMEGVGLYDLGDGRGYLVASSQGNDSYAVFRREGDQAYMGSFIVVADGARGVDGVSETDGLDVTSRNLGPGFEHGAMVAQDGRNVLPGENQNFKYVPWTSIAEALGLEVRR
ncbi:phytase [Brevundimonas sp. P7753]|uniref:phytase n=1 Tax=Brevundimonas sp. P7753 TaxID=2726982 RepID=UPI0015B846DA|nr:phytase [Brevundimonas sp. P7753]NWE50985.1 phytase [Brevundimonas sp. P7753]